MKNRIQNIDFKTLPKIIGKTILFLLTIVLMQPVVGQIHYYIQNANVDKTITIDSGEVVHSDAFRFRMHDFRTFSVYVGGANIVQVPIVNTLNDSNAYDDPEKAKDHFIVIYTWDHTTPNNSYIVMGIVQAVVNIGGITYLQIDLRSPVARNNFLNYATNSGQRFFGSTLLAAKTINLNLGQITCHPFDPPYGGGICGIVCNHLNIIKGTFNVSAKGGQVHPHWTKMAKGGAGGVASTSYNGGGLNGGKSNNTIPCMTPLITGCQGLAGSNGDNAGAFGFAGGSISYNNQMKALPASNNFTNSIVILGKPGTGPIKAGEGGQAGGHGGIGGKICDTINNGAMGSKGYNGQDGQNWNLAGSGGGIIIVKASNITFDVPLVNPSPVFIADGENGYKGANGGNGGTGGFGGKGVRGFCDSGLLSHSGGDGGFGQSGIGGDGAIGGFPGENGSLWIMSMNPPINANSGSTWWNNKLVSINGGLPGRGGSGGYSVRHKSTPPELFDLSDCSPYSWCSGSGDISKSVKEYECDCEKVMCLLGQATSSNSNGTTVTFKTGARTVIYDKNLGIAVTDKDPVTGRKYFCVYHHKSDCSSIFESLNGTPIPLSNISIDLSKTTTDIPNCPYGVISWKQSQVNPAILYNEGRQYIASLTERGIPKCYLNKCADAAVVGDILSEYIKTGADGPDNPYPQSIVPFSIQSPLSSAYFNVGFNPAPKRAGEKLNIPAAPQIPDPILFPNPANSYVNIVSDYTGKSHLLDIYTLGGKIVLTQRSIPQANVIKVDLKAFLPGIYFATLKIDGKVYTYKLIKQ